MRQVSTKQRKIKQEYKQVCNEILEERDNCCEECGANNRLSFSHLIPKSRRPDIQNVKKIIRIHCMSFGDQIGCHNKYEDHQIADFNTKELIIEILMEYDPEYYNLIKDKIH